MQEKMLFIDADSKQKMSRSRPANGTYHCRSGIMLFDGQDTVYNPAREQSADSIRVSRADCFTFFRRRSGCRFLPEQIKKLSIVFIILRNRSGLLTL